MVTGELRRRRQQRELRRRIREVVLQRRLAALAAPGTGVPAPPAVELRAQRVMRS